MDSNISLSPIEDFLSTPSNMNEQTTVDMFAIPTIKVEDASTSTITPDLLSLSTSPPPMDNIKSESKHPVKKRKSWGQVLPEPKTALPPRKRAKTADEKEQRRIERVKRNRLAAHNSRERKREEMDKLQDENDKLVAQMTQMQQQLNQLQDELKLFRAGKTPAVASFDFSTSAPVTAGSTDGNTFTTLTTPELGNLDSPMADDDFSQPPTPAPEQTGMPEQSNIELTQQSAVSFDEACLSQPLFPSLPATKPVQQLNEAHGLPHTGNELSSLSLDVFETFFNFEPEHPQHSTDAGSSFHTDNIDGDKNDSLIPETPESFSTDLLDDQASETSDFLNFLADSGAPLGSDESGFGTEAGDLSQLLSLEAVNV